MTDHLPECPAAAECRCEPDDYGHYPTCPKVYCVCKFHRQGYAAGLDAAREAVAALEPRLKLEKYKGGYCCCGCSTTYDLMDDALAAIDALREKT